MSTFGWRICLLLLVLNCPNSPLQAAPETEGTYYLSNTIQDLYTDDSRIPATQVNQVLQSRDGYLWVASYDGLIRYDGKYSKVFNKRDDGFPSRSIMRLFEDSRGRLWIGTNNAGLVLSDNGDFTTFGRQEGLPSSSVRAVTEDLGGRIYAATALGLMVVTPDFTIEPVTGSDGEVLVASSLLVTRSNELWCVLNDGGILILKEGQKVRRYPPWHFGLGRSRVAFQDSKGDIYLAGTGDQVTIIGTDGSETTVGTGSLNHINSFYEDSQGRIWLCADTGLGFFENQRFYEIEGALIESAMRSMTEDFEGNLWFASNRLGLLQVIKSRFENISRAYSLPPLIVNAALVHEGRLYVGSDDGLFIAGADGERIDNNLIRTLRGLRVRAVVDDGAGHLWIATYSPHGLIRYRPADETFTSFSRAGQGLISDTVRCVLAGRDGRVYAGTADGISVIEGDRVVKNYTEADGLINKVILNLHEDEKGRIYAGSDGGGVYVIDGNEVTNLSEADGLSSGVIMRLKYDPVYRGLWISTENSVCFWGENGLQNLDQLDAFGVNVFDIQFNDDRDLWLLSSRGIYITDRARLLAGESPEIELLQRRDGLSATLTANSWNHLDDKRRLFLCTNTGVLSIDMDSLGRKGAPPRLVIPSASIDERSFSHPSSIKLSAEAQRLTIDFALISYTYPTGNTVNVHLKGFDREPERLSTDQHSAVSYTNLPGGEYEFVISGRNRDGVESRIMTLPITKQPRLRERPIFQALVTAGLLALFILGARSYNKYKTKALVKRQQEYREITDQAIRAIADTIDAKDQYTSGHSKRVAEYSRKIAERLGLSEKRCEDLYYAALLHDIGKIGLEDSILNKRGRLTGEEYEKMKKHVTIGGDILKSITVIEDISTGARYHHERYDGRGYGEGLKAEDIPLFARIICVADAYDAMSTDRPYRDGLSQEYIFNELKTGAGAQFDGRIVAVLIDIIGSQPAGEMRP